MSFGRSILGRRHVLVNGIYLPANLALEQARRSCVPLHASTGDPAWPVRNLGSGVLYAYGERRYCVFTRHQLGRDIDPSQVYIRLTPQDHSLHGGARYFEFPQPHSDLEEHDLCLLEMPWTLPQEAGTPQFFQAIPPIGLGDNEAERYFAVGYPSALTTMDVSEDDGRNEHIWLSQVIVTATSLVLRRGDLPRLDLVKGDIMLPRCGGDFDGFSGGPVFGVNHEAAAVILRGIVVRGGIDKLFFIPIEWVQRLCDIALSAPELEREAA